MYALSRNYWDFVLPTVAGMLPVPQRYYIPGRLRDTYKARLEAVGLWDITDNGKKNASTVSGHYAQFNAAFGKSRVRIICCTIAYGKSNSSTDANYS